VSGPASRPSAPPASLRPTVTAEERTLVEQVVGPVADDVLLRAVRDARGRTFQRLEFLGDSVLDLLLAIHVAVEPDCPACLASPRRGDPSRLVTDRRLAERARAHGMGDWLEWEASDDRMADLVETAVAAAWLSGGWGQAVPVVRAVVHPVGPEAARVLDLGGAAAAPATAAVERRLGASVLELAAAVDAYRRLPDADEGALSQHRAQRHRAPRVAAYAARTGLAPAGGDPDVVSDRVERWLARELLEHGADAALATASDVLA
jgi:dsRNA-specific ribonuclease